MKLCKHQKARLRTWEEGELYNGEGEPMLPKVVAAVISELVFQRKPRTSKGLLDRIDRASRLVRKELRAIRRKEAKR